MTIPWPDGNKTDELVGVDPNKKRAPETQPSDTPAKLVEKPTFFPTLLMEPLPSSIIDELRNKYSKFRDRHDPSYVEYQERKAAKVERRA